MGFKNVGHIALKTLKWTAISVIGLIILIPILLYIPFIQDIAKNIAIKEIEKSTGMKVELSYLRLKFPLRVQLEGLAMIEDRADTLLSAREAEVDVAFLPLLRGRLDVESAELRDATYRLNNPDSAIYLKARIDNFSTVGTGLTLNMKELSVGKTLLDGADVSLVLKDTVENTKSDSTSSLEMLINAPDVTLRNVRFRMAMLPTIDSLGAVIGEAHLAGGRLDMKSKTIDADELRIDSVTATYLLPTPEFLANYKSPSDSVAAKPADDSGFWKILGRHVVLSSSNATYAVRGSRPTPGLDMSSLQASDISIEVDSFYNEGTKIRVPLRQLSGRERCGINLLASGLFEMDSTRMEAKDFDIRANESSLKLNAMMGMGEFTPQADIPVMLNAQGKIMLRDVVTALPSLDAFVKDLPRQSPLNLSANVNGSTRRLDIEKITAEIPNYLTLHADGQVENPLDFNRLGGQIAMDGALTNVNFAKAMALSPSMAKQIKLPPMKIKGTVDYNPGAIDGNITLSTGSGSVAAQGKWVQRCEGYKASLDVHQFPVQNFMPSLGVADLTAKATVNGRGYDPMRRSTHAEADIQLGRVTYNGRQLSDISLNASLDTCRLTSTVLSRNPGAEIDADLTAWFSQNGYEWDLTGQVGSLDLAALGLSKETMGGSVDLYTNGRYNPRNGDIDAELELNHLNWQMGNEMLIAQQSTAKLSSTDSLTRASVVSGDFNADLSAICGLDTLLRRMTSTSDELMRQIDQRDIDIRKVQKALPQMNLSVHSGSQNLVADYLQSSSDILYKTADLSLTNDSLISLYATATGISTSSIKLDSVRFDANQHNQFLVYHLAVNNRPGTLDQFAHVDLKGFLAADKFSAMLRQQNIKNEQGFNIGLQAQLADSTIHVKFVPYKPTIAYRKWSINHDNFLSYNIPTRHLDANLALTTDSSALKIYTVHQADSLATGQEDVVVQLDNINIAEWLSISPFAPPIKGDVNANLRFRWDRDILTGKGFVDLDELYYGRDRVGTFRLDMDVASNAAGAINADIGLMVDSVRVMTATGCLNDSTRVNPFLLDFSMIHFPLRVVNPFLPKDVAQMSGMLNGRMDITGSVSEPKFNGYLDFDSTAVRVGMTGASYRFSEERIPVDSNIVYFRDFKINGLNENPLRINGTVNATKLTDIGIDLAAKASDMMIVNSNRPRGANVYGKAYIDLDAKVKGNMQFLNVDADLNLLAGTNVTYVVTSSQSVIASQKNDQMVRFVSFSDTTQVAQADSIATPSLAMNINANLTISPGSTINVDLSTDGKNRGSIQSQGQLSYSQTPMSSEGRLTGRLNINQGFVRYTPPLMSEKNFEFQEGSYIAFNGPILNPTLNIKAIDHLKANVTQSGQDSRLVNFDVLLTVTNTLENMNVAFDLTTNDDITVENELSSMSPEQRANQAMNMLLYNTYTGPGTKGNANLSGNPLFSFLSSQLNSWAAQNIRGVDISFGIDQYDKTTDGSKSTTTSYSYRISKSLFNDRFKIIIGGNYSTDADADENFQQNLINDISFEYMLNRSGSMYVKLFRHQGYESILEGEITETGVGFVMKRKLNSLRDLFRFGRRRSQQTQTPTKQ